MLQNNDKTANDSYNKFKRGMYIKKLVSDLICGIEDLPEKEKEDAINYAIQMLQLLKETI